LAAWHWAWGILGLWLAWVVLTFLSLLTGFVWGTNQYIQETIENNTVISIPDNWKNVISGLNSWFTSIWNIIGLIVFTAFTFYILINSMRRRVEEYYF